MIEIRNLTKRYGPVTVVDDFSLEVPAGEAVALWGPNGAGKTTVVRCILGLVDYEGTIVVDGLDARTRGKAVRSRIGYVAQELAFYDDMAVLDVLDYSAALRGLTMERVDEVVETFRLGDHRTKRVGELSGGLKQRLGLAAALLPDPPVLLLDEPTASLDAHSREETIGLFEDLRAQGRTIVLTTHHMEEMGMLVDRVVAMENGRIVTECPPGELAERLGLRVWLHLIVDPDERSEAQRVLEEAGLGARRNAAGLVVEVPAQEKGRALALLHRAGIELRDLEVWT
ncbi:MAG TPA: ABC transporter ATP-binding protein [Actinobacteria bacterium]|nr:ABC transporter ATP-binding protein [Actinomycetota bacterium]